MSFQKGKNKTGGRKAGGKNKNTLLLETFAQTIVEGGMEKFQRELNKLSGKDYIIAYMAMFEFVKPKLARAEIKAEHQKTVIKVGYGPKPDYSKLSVEELRQLHTLIKKTEGKTEVDNSPNL